MSDWQDRLDEAMELRGLSGGDLARKTGFTSQYINSMRSKGRGGRLPLETARRLAHALAVSGEWLTQGTGPRERLSDVYPVFAPDGAAASDRYSGRAEAIALLETTAEAEVLAALRASVPEDPAVDPGRDYWIKRAKELARDLRRIKADPDLAVSGARPPESGFRENPFAGDAPSAPAASAGSRKKKRGSTS